MPFKSEVATLRAQGAASLQHDFLVKDAYQRGAAKAPPPGAVANHVTPTAAESNEYSKYTNYPAQTAAHGVFFLMQDVKSQKIVASSSNTSLFFGGSAEEVLGKKLSELFVESHRIDSALKLTNFEAANPITVTPVGDSSATVNVILQRSPNGITADVEELDPCEDFLAINDAARAAVGMLDTCGSVQELCQQLTWDAFGILGCDRMAVYHFHEDGVGEVLAERRSKRVTNPFLGMSWFPTDFPPQTRHAFLTRAYARMIVDASEPAIDIVTAAPHLAPEDICLKDSTLRATHQCLAEQMACWGHKAMISFALIAHGRLFGMLCGTHCSAKPVSFQTRLAVGALVQGFNLRLSRMMDRQVLAGNENLTKVLGLLSQRALGKADGASKLQSLFEGTSTLCDCVQGVKSAAILHEGKVTSFGEVPPADVLSKVVEGVKKLWVANGMQPVGIPQVSLTIPEMSAYTSKNAGVMAVPLLGGNSTLLLFRPETQKTVVWAGDPSKIAIKDRATGLVYPRKDYAETPVKQFGRSTDWVRADEVAAVSLASLVVAILQDKLGSKTALEAAPFPVMTTDKGGNVTVWNESVAQATGVSATEAVGKLLGTLVTPKSQEVLQNLLIQANQGALSAGGEVCVTQKEKGEEGKGVLSVKGMPWTDGDVAIVGLDIAGTYSAEANFKRLSAQLGHVDRTGGFLRPNNMVVNVQAMEDNFEYFPDKSDSSSAFLREDGVSKTYLMVHKKDGVLYAVRKINVKKADRAGLSLVALKRAVFRLMRLTDSSLVRYRACFSGSDGKNLCVVTNFEGITLKQAVEDAGGTLSEEVVLEYARSVFQALDRLHSKGVVHGALSSVRMVVLEDGEVKIADIPLRCDTTPEVTAEEDVKAAAAVLLKALGEKGGKAGTVLTSLAASPSSAAQALAQLA